MEMIYLTEDDIDTLQEEPGAYILGVPPRNPNDSGDSIYIGRSENLKRRLNDYLTDNHENDCIKEEGPDRFWYEYSDSTYGAYKLECQWYHKYAHHCNSQHPEKDEDWWSCPVCEE